VHVCINMVLIIAVGGRPAVHICARRPADWNVSLQVQADETDSYVQGPETRHLLPIQHREFHTHVIMSVMRLIALCVDVHLYHGSVH